MCCEDNEIMVGDEVKVKSLSQCRAIGHNGDTGSIDEVDKHLACGKTLEVVKVCRSGNLKLRGAYGELKGTFDPRWVDVVCDEEETFDTAEEPYYNNGSTANKPKNMNSIISFVKNLTLSADDKLLRKFNLADQCGDYTTTARELVLQKLVADNKAYLVEQATAFEAEEKANKDA